MHSGCAGSTRIGKVFLPYPRGRECRKGEIAAGLREAEPPVSLCESTISFGSPSSMGQDARCRSVIGDTQV